MAALVLVLSIATRLWGERIGINGGQGWDGELYVKWAAAFRHDLFVTGTTTYHAQRVLPSAVINAAMSLVGAKPTVANILLAFHILDTAMLMLAALLWARIGDAMRWRAASVWAGFAGMFGSFALARHALYYPALTDTTAFALGMAVTWGYLAPRTWGTRVVLWLCVGVSMFTWPGMTPIAALALLLPRGAVPASDAPSGRSLVRAASAIVAVVLTVAFLLSARHYLAHPVQELGIPKFATWVRRDRLPITVPLLAAFLLLAWFSVLYHPHLWNLRDVVRSLVGDRRWRTLLVSLAGIAVWFVLRKLWLAAVATQGPGPSTAQFVCLQVLEALRGPAWGPVHHVVYVGPLVALGLLEWRRVTVVIGSWGHAAVAGFAMLVVFLAASESRQWIHLLPLFGAAVIAATDARWTPRRAIVFAAIVLAWSKLWLHIGYNTPGDWRVFPTQRYFMHLGPWASDTTWAWHGLAAIVTTAGLWLLLRSSPGARREALPAPPDHAPAHH